MSIDNFVSGGKIWDPAEEKKRSIEETKRFKRQSLAILLIGLFITASSIVSASIFRGDTAFSIKDTDSSLLFDGQVRYFVFYLLGAVGPAFLLMGWVMLAAERFSDKAGWIFTKKKPIFFSLLAVVVLWSIMFNIVTGIGKEINSYDETDGKQVETIQSWVKGKTGSTVTENQAKALLNPSIDDITIGSGEQKVTFHTEKTGDLSTLITIVKETGKK